MTKNTKQNDVKDDVSDDSEDYESRKLNLNSMEKLYAFMEKYRVTDNKSITHTIMYNPRGSYNIPETVYGIFRKLYANAILEGYSLHIVERHKNVGPIIIDLDFKYHKSKRQYTLTTIRNIVRVYNDIISRYLSVNEDTLIAYVSEKSKPALRSNLYCDGIHIVYPHICTNPILQHIIRCDFIKRVQTKNNIFKCMKLENSLDDVVDKSVIHSNGWLMYGSTKNPHCDVYRVTHIFSQYKSYETTRESIELIDTLIKYEKHDDRITVETLIDYLSVRRFNDEKDITTIIADRELLDKKHINVKNKINKNLPTQKRENINEIMGPDTKFTKIAPQQVYVDACNLVKLLSKKRATEYSSWYQTGKCLYNIDHRLLKNWIEFSKTTLRKNFDEKKCHEEWGKMKLSNYTISTLHFYASGDSPIEYKKYKQEKITHLLDC